jgi:hypothetical protein
VASGVKGMVDTGMPPSSDPPGFGEGGGTELATGREGSLWSATSPGERRLARRRVSRC